MNQTVQGEDYGQNFGEILGIPGLNGPDIRQSGFPNINIGGYTGTGVPGWMPLFRTEEATPPAPTSVGPPDPISFASALTVFCTGWIIGSRKSAAAPEAP